MKQSKLFKAITLVTALGGAGAGLYMSTAGAVNMPANGLGQELIFPYYTARDNWQTTLNFINTDQSKMILVKFRFMEGYNSRDVLDFNVIMSPGDMFSGVIEQGGSTGTQFRRAPGDTTCTSSVIAPGASLPLSPVAFTGTNVDTGPADNDRLSEGYVIAIVMGAVDVGADADIAPAQPTLKGWKNTAAASALKTAATAFLGAVHAPGGATTCAPVDQQFLKTNILTTARLFGAPVNVLKGNYTFLNVPRGTSAGGNATALANSVFLNAGGAPRNNCTTTYIDQFTVAGGGLVPNAPPYAGPVVWDPNVDPNDCPNLITAQQYPDFLQPTLGSVYPRRSYNLENAAAAPGGVNLTQYALADANALVNTYLGGAAAVAEVLRADTVINEWSINPNLGVSTDWIITHPIKSVFVDYNPNTVQAAVNQAWFPYATVAQLNTFVPTGPFASAFDKLNAAVPPVITGTGKSCNNVGFRVRDVDEQASTQGTNPSPQPPATNLQLCYETNVLTFSGDGTRSEVFDSKLVPPQLSNVIAAVNEVHGLSGKYSGWMLLDLITDTAAATHNAVNFPGPTVGSILNGPGLPAVGFMIRQRAIPTGSILDNYSDAANHSVVRTVFP